MLFLVRMCFLLLSIVSVTAGGILLCLLFLRSKNRVYRIAQVFSKVASLFGLSVEKRTSALSDQVHQAVYIANHQNNFDLFTVSTALPKRVVTIGKSSLIWIPFFGALYWISGNILINRNNRTKAIATIDQVVLNMKKRDLSIWMFPEGTRSRGRGMLPFKSGAFHAAIQAGVPIIPVVCSNTHDQVKLNRLDNGRVIVEMLDPISTVGLNEGDVSELMRECERKMQDTLERLDKELAHS